jgi:hypothetical protein
MRILLSLNDGSEETRDVAKAAILIDSWRLEMKTDENPYLMHLYVPQHDEEYCSFVVRPGAANSMRLEIEAHPGKKSG